MTSPTDSKPASPDARPAATFAPERRVHVAWQVWFDGEIARAPLALADGVVVVVDHGGHSQVRRLDETGAIQWERDLDGRASGDPARTLGWLAIPCDGTRVVQLLLETGARAGLALSVPGLALCGPIAALSGRIVARFASSSGDADPFIAVADPARPDLNPALLADPIGRSIESRFRVTNHALILAGEDPDGFASIAAVDFPAHAGPDHAAHRTLWTQRVADCGLSFLWAAGGLVDVVFTDRVTSFDARSGHRLTTRFEGMVLDNARIAGETLLVTLGGHDAPGERLLMAFDTMTESPFGEHKGLNRVVGACSDECLVADADDRPLLLELPSLLPTPIRSAEDVASPRMVAWSRHRAYVIGHDGHSLSAIDLT